MAVTVFIYALTDPDTGEVRYIGKSICPEKRLLAHLRDKSKCHRAHWIQSLLSAGKKPGLFIVESIVGAWPWQESERFWIRRCKLAGCRLTNNTSGGDGVPGLPEETRKRMAATWTGKKHTPQSIEKIRLASTGRRHSESYKQRMRELMTGRKIAWVYKVAASLRKLTPQQCEEIMRRLNNGERNKDLAKEYGVHRTTLSKIKTGQYS